MRNDDDPSQTSFWYLPRPNVSHDGLWALFTSNWKKTLGTELAGDSGERARQDVFLVRLGVRSKLRPCEPASLRPRQAGCTSVTR